MTTRSRPSRPSVGERGEVEDSVNSKLTARTDLQPIRQQEKRQPRDEKLSFDTASLLQTDQS